MGGLRCRLGRRPQLHRLRAAAARLHQRDVRGQARRHAGCRRFRRVCAQHGVKVLFTAPTAMRAIKQQDPEGKLLRAHDLSKLEALFLAGERCNLRPRCGRPICWASRWSTTGGRPRPAGRSPAVPPVWPVPFKPGSGGRPSPGNDLHAIDDEGHEVPAGQTGNLGARLPLPPVAHRRYGRTTTATRPPISRISPAGIAPGMPEPSTRMAMSG